MGDAERGSPEATRARAAVGSSLFRDMKPEPPPRAEVIRPGFRLRSSGTPFGSMSASRSAIATSKICSPSAVVGRHGPSPCRRQRPGRRVVERPQRPVSFSSASGLGLRMRAWAAPSRQQDQASASRHAEPMPVHKAELSEPPSEQEPRRASFRRRRTVAGVLRGQDGCGQRVDVNPEQADSAGWRESIAPVGERNP